jgi:hypothetical protein
MALERPDAPQVADLAAQRSLGRAANAFAQIGQAQRPVEMGAQDGDTERTGD